MPETQLENPIVRLDTCCGCIQLKLGILILCVLQMITSAFLILVIGIYMISGVMLAEENLLVLGGAFTMFSLFIVLLLSCAEFGFALYAFSDIRRAEPLGIRYYYMFKLVSLGFSLLVFVLTTTWTTPEVFNMIISVTFSLYCIWCIWSLHEALMLGGEAAARAGFTTDEASENSPLLNKAEVKPQDNTSQYV